ncbi:hypothetical protein AWB78_08456 [Caballeronia calidae]|uniref:Uncharacterized protein n=1 Tax=Caballeronia calidae TaxID=1777139 RepID=A0A158ELD6_9BURK|nr:hypothetical protein [Caballeronia calidae]SAL07176.1 hypothetical protein AWB78_08456 [Caballeronia calidae]
MESLTALLSAYDALTDKTTFYAQGLQGIIVEREAQLKATLRDRILELSSSEGWTDTRIATELNVLDGATGKILSPLDTKYFTPRATSGNGPSSGGE